VGNFTVQNADLILAVGTRLSQNITGGMLDTFASHAFLAMVDADPGEMAKFDGRGIAVSLRLEARAGVFLEAFLDAVPAPLPARPAWSEKITHWRSALPDECRPREARGVGFVDAYRFVDELSNHLPEGEPIFVDTGGNLTWTCNALRVKRGQRLLSAWNNTPMGYALPAAIGAAFLDRSRPVTCIIGDGGLMICLAELATLVKHGLPVRLILFNNHGHGIQRQTLETWLDGRYEGVHPESGLAFPDFKKLAAAMGFKPVTIDDHGTLSARLTEVFRESGPVFINVEIDPEQKLYPVLKFGASLENQLPALSPEFIASEMVVASRAAASASHGLMGTPGV